MTRSRLESFKGGCVAGFAASVLLQPLDVIKTRLQGQVLTQAGPGSLLNTTRTILKENGLLGLWRGIVPTVARATAGPGLYFVFLEEMQALEAKESNQWILFVQGATARAIAGTILCPMTVIKTRYEMSQLKTNPSVLRTLYTIAKEEKLRGLFSGLGPMLVRDVPQSGLYLFFYSSVFKPMYKSVLPASLSTETNVTACSAFTAAGVSTAITLPADVVKTRLQVAPTNETVANIVYNMLKVHGVRSLFSGLSTRLIRRPIQLTITWTVYDHYRNKRGH